MQNSIAVGGIALIHSQVNIKRNYGLNWHSWLTNSYKIMVCIKLLEKTSKTPLLSKGNFDTLKMYSMENSYEKTRFFSEYNFSLLKISEVNGNTDIFEKESSLIKKMLIM